MNFVKEIDLNNSRITSTFTLLRGVLKTTERPSMDQVLWPERPSTRESRTDEVERATFSCGPVEMEDRGLFFRVFSSNIFPSIGLFSSYNEWKGYLDFWLVKTFEGKKRSKLVQIVN